MGHGSVGSAEEHSPSVVLPDGTDDQRDRLAEENERLRAELQNLKGSGPGPRPPSRHRVRKGLTAFLVFLVTICVVASTAGFWVHRTISNEDRYVALVAPLVHDPAVTNALGTKLSAAAFEALDVQHRVEQALGSIPKLPPQAQFLAGPITSGVRTVIERGVHAFLASDAFANLWVAINRTAHAKVQALLNGDYSQLPNVSIDGGEVRLNLVSAVAAVLHRLVQRGANGLGLNVTIPDIPPDLASSAAIQKLGTALGVTLPPNFGQVTLMTENQLTGYQKAVQQAKRLLGLMYLVTLVLIGAVILTSTNRRRVVIWLGLSIVAGLLLAGVFLRRVQADIVDRIKNPGGRAAAHDVFAQVTSGLRSVGIFVVVVAVVAALVAYVAGRPRWLRRARDGLGRLVERHPGGSRLDRWVASNATPVTVGAITIAVIVLLITGLSWIPVGIVLVLLAFVLWGVGVARRRAAPDADTPVSSGETPVVHSTEPTPTAPS